MCSFTAMASCPTRICMDGLVGEVPGLDAHKVVEHLLGGPVGEAAEDVLRAVHVDDGLGLLKAQVGGVVIPRARMTYMVLLSKSSKGSLLSGISGAPFSWNFADGRIAAIIHLIFLLTFYI